MRSRFGVLSFAVVLIFSVAAKAREENSGGGIYFGVGLLRSMSTYKAGMAESVFNGWGAIGTVGASFVSSGLGGFIEGEYGRTEALNTLQSTTYLEKATNNYVGAKAGLSYGIFGLGGGAQQNNIDVDNVSSSGTSGRTSYKGLSYAGFVRLSFDTRDFVRTILEAKYGTGQVSGLDLGETVFSLRIVFRPF